MSLQEIIKQGQANNYVMQKDMFMDFGNRFIALDSDDINQLQGLGVNPNQFNQQVMTMDSNINDFNASNVGIPQFMVTAYNLDPVRQITRKYTYKKISEEKQYGDFTTNQMFFTTLAISGEVNAYAAGATDSGQGFNNANMNMEPRGMQRFQTWLNVNELEEAMYGKAKINIYQEKINAMMTVIEQTKDDIFFSGLDYNLNVRGILNDSDLNAYITFPATASDPTTSSWAVASVNEQISDFQLMYSQLATQMLGHVDLSSLDETDSEMTLVIYTGIDVYTMTPNPLVTSSFRDWAEKVFRGRLKIVTSPKLKGTTGVGDNKMILFLNRINGQDIIQNGFSYNLKAFRVEPYSDYIAQKFSFSSAGFIGRYPLAIVRSTGS